MKYLIELNHPKHYYQFRSVAQLLKAQGDEVHYIARDKDILLSILAEEHVEYESFGIRTDSILDKTTSFFKIQSQYLSIVRRYRPDVILSKASLFGTVSARIVGCKSVIFPDSEVVKLTNRVVAPLSSAVITPSTFGLDYGKKHHRVSGFFENCYLSPMVFSPDPSVLSTYGLQQPYAIFRFIGWNANHDIGQGGFTYEQKLKLVEAVSESMTVYISSETPLPKELESYRLPTPSSLMHHVLAMADLYIGDSQTMATEAALLGVPAIRSNSWVGPNDMTNFKILEKDYGLLRNLRSYSDVLQVAQDFSAHSMKQEWKSRQAAYYQKVGDVNRNIVDILNSIR